MEYTTVIGLEIHAELLTESKVFCGCSAAFGGEENTRVCPLCAGLPGTLPTINRGAVELAVKAGFALGCHIHRYSAFDRKNYFYPDLPKAYQITQFFHPICTGGAVQIGKKSIGITRIHIEEDAGKLIHEEKGNSSFADYNRCGVPLIEIVTEPDLRSAEEARELVEQVALRLKYAGVCDAKMEQGSLRCDVNISLMPRGSDVFGTRTEIKNLNSLRSVVRAISAEEQRQKAMLEKGQPILQQTLHWNDAEGCIKVLRTKEEAHDYRYFPEPDLPPVWLQESDITALRNQMPEMPDHRKGRFINEMGLSEADATLLVAEKELADFFETATSYYHNPKAVASMLLVELLRRLKEEGKLVGETTLPPRDFATLCRMAEEGVVNRASAKDLLTLLLQQGGDPMKTAEAQGMLMSCDTDMVYAAVEEILNQNPKAVAEWQAGSQKVFGFFMGQACRKLGKSANPAIIKQVLEERLS